MDLNNKEIEQTTTAVWLIKLIDQSLLFFLNGLKPKNFNFFFIQKKFNLNICLPVVFSWLKTTGKQIAVDAT